MQGTVYLLGAGPGDPSLMTLRGKELIAEADCLIYDALIAPEILSWAKPGCVSVYVGKRASNHAMPQEEINRLLVESSRRFERVVRVKGGDPYVFGRGGEEGEALAAAGVPFQVVPGISSAIAGPAYAGIPVTHRGVCTQFTVFTGHEDPEKGELLLDIEGIARAQGTKIMLMGMSRLAETLEKLVAAGQNPETPAAAVQWAATGRQKSVRSTVGGLAAAVRKAGLGAPAIVVIGEVVRKANELDWYEKLPLFGKRIVVTRTREQAGALTSRLRELGADVIELPTIRIADPEDKQTFAELVVDAHHYNWLVFTSPNGVKRFFQAFFAAYPDIRHIGGARIAAIGPGTVAELKKYGLAVDLVPEKAVAEELLKAFVKERERVGGVENCTMLWVRGAQARDVLYKGLMAMGAIVDECIAYSTVAETQDLTGAQERLKREGADVITFTSSSTVRHFMELNIPIPPRCRVVSIGPVTTATLHEYGVKPVTEARKHDIDGVVEAILKLRG